MAAHFAARAGTRPHTYLDGKRDFASLLRLLLRHRGRLTQVTILERCAVLLSVVQSSAGENFQCTPMDQGKEGMESR